MAGHIYKKTIKGNTYYYYQENYREKITATTTAEISGKTKGTGKSRVKSKSIYLGTAEQIHTLVKNNRQIPQVVKKRAFGLVAAAYQTAKEIGLTEVLAKHITGTRYGIPRWIFFLVTMINRLDNATSKNKMCEWIKATILPDILRFDTSKLNSKNYWYITDDVISEEETLSKRAQGEKDKKEEDIFSGLDDHTFIEIEKELFTKLQPYFGDHHDTLIYDTTNFYTFFESDEFSDLAQTGHNKDSRHHLKQVGLAMAIERNVGLPFFHRVYRGNRQDALVFSKVIEDIITNVKSAFPKLNDLVLVLDKGNNSAKNFNVLDGKITWVGSLAPSKYLELVEIPLEQYQNISSNYKAFHCLKSVMGKERLLVMTYNQELAKKQEHTLQHGITKLIAGLNEKYNSYQHKPNAITRGLKSILSDSHYHDCIEIGFDATGMEIACNNEAILKRRKTFGKNLLFTSKTDAAVEWVIAQYKERNNIEDIFRTLKDVELIRIRPIRHFTDSKIRAHIFCCVMSFLLIRMMQLKAQRAGIDMSPIILKEELSDLEEVIMIYDNHQADIKITQPSAVQRKLFNLFQLEKIQDQLTIHYN
jgi:transposase